MEQREDNKNDVAPRRLENLFGEALGDLPSVEETEIAWQAFASRRRQKRVRTLLFGFAAVASVALLLFWGLSRENFLSQEVEVFASVNSPDKLMMTEAKGIIAVRTPPATTVTIYLPDSTEVLLNANSRLEYPKVFTGDLRQVMLEGAARFNVQRDALHPFIVETGSLQTRVLGTVFDVDSYGCGTTSKVVLYEGSVQVSDKASTQVCKIKPGEQVYLDRVGDICISQADICMQKSWTEGLFIFDNVTLRYVMQEIGAWYNTNIVFRSHSLLEERIYFSASRHLPVGEILNVLNDLQIARFIVEGNKIIVSPLS